MGSPYFTTGPVAPATDPMPSTPKKSPYAPPTSADGGSTVPPLPFIPPGKITSQLDTPYELTASAGMARQIATDLDSTNSKAGPGAHSLTEYAGTAAGKIRGFSFGGALTGSTERWLQQCKTLHDKLANAATGLEQTRQNYHSNELTTVADLRATR
ncbi:hypothetical protein [Streptomyces sp. CBMA123]|uniref:hypothetical protein n=1 Tax=Streptomyces sp. CBMA123 TaxID=1896313 RepID=UPI001661B0C5|nr:hypothetical protein [Streptomyces sp. CBMA123]MBD0695038.1 hypothetical protein [Streptomyces sp. CBMA123]